MRKPMLFICLLIAGCSTQLPRVKPPQIDAAAAAEGAIRAFDKDGDGALSRDESAACRGIQSAWGRYDRDRDGRVSREELTARFAEWGASDTGMMNLRVQVQYRKQPLPDAQVRLTPYEFLGDQFLAAEGVTDQYGYAFLSIPADRLPPSQQGIFGMQVGLYRATVEHPSIKPADKYAAQSPLSVDLSPAEANTGVSLELD
ncbi:MAG: EF-hand domain-containing protein [Pirellulales bacterium]